MAFKVREQLGKARADEAWKNSILTALGAFMLDVGRYPTEKEGLKALVESHGIPKWDGPYWKPEHGSVLQRFGYNPRGTDEP